MTFQRMWINSWIKWGKDGVKLLTKKASVHNFVKTIHIVHSFAEKIFTLDLDEYPHIINNSPLEVEGHLSTILVLPTTTTTSYIYTYS